MNVNEIWNEDCFESMKRMAEEKQFVNIVLTSPPYHTPNDDASSYTPERFKNYQNHYDVFTGWKSNEEYRDWTVELFNSYDSVLAKDGVVLYNISYTANNPDCVYLVLYDVITKTNFTVVDCISWKKNSALPMNMNSNRLTRICEFVFVLCRKSEVGTFQMNKLKSGSKYKNLFYNYVEAANNDILSPELNKLNGATFSSDLVTQLLGIYAKPNDVIYDSFMGTGTTAVGCKRLNLNYLGSELSAAQVELAKKRLSGVNVLKTQGTERLF